MITRRNFLTHSCALGAATGGRADAHAGEYARQGLHRELGLVLVARAVQSDDEAVADELVAAHALERGQVLQAHGRGRAREREPEHESGQAAQQPGQQAPGERRGGAPDQNG